MDRWARMRWDFANSFLTITSVAFSIVVFQVTRNEVNAKRPSPELLCCPAAAKGTKARGLQQHPSLLYREDRMSGIQTGRVEPACGTAACKRDCWGDCEYSSFRYLAAVMENELTFVQRNSCCLWRKGRSRLAFSSADRDLRQSSELVRRRSDRGRRRSRCASSVWTWRLASDEGGWSVLSPLQVLPCQKPGQKLTPLGTVQPQTSTSSYGNTRGVRFIPPIAILRARSACFVRRLERLVSNVDTYLNPSVTQALR
jgi:hypothetical protein